MKNILVFLCCISALTLSSCKKKPDEDPTYYRSVYNQANESSLHVYRTISDYSYYYDYTSSRILLYEDDGTLQILTEEEVTNKVFKSGTKVRVGLVLYKYGVEIARSDDSKVGCEFKEQILSEGYNYLYANISKACAVDNDGDGNVDVEPVTPTLSCWDSKEVYSYCKFSQLIDKTDSFYSSAIPKLSDCSNYSEVVCYFDNSDQDPIVYLSCVTENEMSWSTTKYCLHDDNKLQIGNQKYSAVSIGTTSIL